MRLIRVLLSGVAFALAMVNCATKNDKKNMADPAQTATHGKIQVSPYGQLPDGRQVSQYTLVNRHGMTMKVINYGGIVTSLAVPDRSGKFEDVVLGFDSLGSYLEDSPYFGCIVGRYGNRIAKGQFSLDGKPYTLAQNNDGNHLHGGIKGFDKVFWNIEEQVSAEGPAISLTYRSTDMEEGYPGNLDVRVTYLLTDSNEWKITYEATTDRKTIVNLTQHTYFNLTGNTKKDILGHELQLNADRFIPVDRTLIPTGVIEPVSGTPFDFESPSVIGARIGDDHQQLVFGGGYDHCWVLRDGADSLKLAATLHDPSSGRVMTTYTTEPGIQFYSGNFLDGSLTGKFNTVYEKRFGLCLETEHFPDSPNQPAFPSVELDPGQVYRTETVYAFSTR